MSSFYGTLEGYLKAVSTKDGKELWKFKTPSGIIGNVFTYQYDGKQYVGVYSGIGGWAGIGMAAGLTGKYGRSRRRRRLQGSREVHDARRIAVRVCAAG